MRDSIARNVVILPEGDTADRCRAWSGAIADCIESDIDLRRADMLPHVSLYNTAYPVGSDDALRERIADFATTRRPFELHLIEPATVHGYVFANAELSTEIDAIHHGLIIALNPIRDGAFDPTALSLELTDRERECLTETGMILSLEGFLPHVTLSRPINPSKIEAALALVPDVSLKFPVSSIHLVESGPNGTCKRIIESFALAG